MMETSDDEMVKKAVDAIKIFQSANTQLECKLQACQKSKENALDQLHQLKTKYEELVKETSTSTMPCHVQPNNSVNDERLAKQSIELQQRPEVRSILEDKDSTIQHLQRLLKTKDEEIANYKRSQSIEAPQVSQMRTILQKVFSLSRPYAAEMNTLQGQEDSFGLSTNRETVQAQAVTGDEDLNGSATLSPCSSNPLDRHVENQKSEENELRRQLQEVSRQLEETRIQLDRCTAANLHLEEEKQALIEERNLSMKHDSDNLLAARKVFEDDFNYERNEKIQKYKENQELRGQNEKLQNDCKKLQEELSNLQLIPSVKERALIPGHQQMHHLKENFGELAYPSEQHHEVPPNARYPEQLMQIHQGGASTEVQPFSRQQSISVHPTSVQAGEQTRRIGFPLAHPPEGYPSQTPRGGRDYYANPFAHPGPRHPMNPQMQSRCDHLATLHPDDLSGEGGRAMESAKDDAQT